MQSYYSKKPKQAYGIQIAICLLLVPFFKPVGIAVYPVLNDCFVIWKIISMGILTFVFIWNIKAIKLSIWEMSIIFFLLICLIDALRFSGSLMDWLLDALPVIYIVLFIQICFCCDKNDDLLKASCWLFRGLILINLVSALYIRLVGPLFQVIENDFTYFLGTDNYSAFSMLPFFLILFISHSLVDTNESEKRVDYILYIGSVLFFIFVQSLSAAGAFLVFGVLVFLYQRIPSFPRLLTPLPFLLFLAIVLIFILGFQAHQIIGDILIGSGKGLSLNSRTDIWEGALNLIQEQPLLGYGSQEDFLGSTFLLYGASHAHNLLLDMLLRGGVIGAVLYLYFLAKPFTQIVPLQKNKAVWCMLSFFVAYGMISFMDFYPFYIAPIFAITFAYYCGQLILKRGKLIVQ